jgi:poly(hydroxyalkanoate) granule-associated protein
MVKKAEESTSLPPSPALAQAVKDSAQQIWLAGMGAFAKAQQEGGKVFEALVKEGAGLQRKTQTVAEGRFAEVAQKVTAVAEGVGSKAGQQWDKLESIFEQRVAKALQKLGVPAQQEVQALTDRIDALSAQVSKLAKAARHAPPRAPAKSTSAASSGAASRSDGATPRRRAAPRKTAT